MIKLTSKITLFFLMFVFFSTFLNYYLNHNIQLIKFDNGLLTISDLTYHLLLGKSLWKGSPHSVYLVDGQISILSDSLKEEIVNVMPVGITPIGFLILAPFVLISSYSLILANALWMSIGLTLVVVGVLEILKKPEFRIKAIALAIFFSSLTFVTAVLLGQTSVLALGLLVFLWLRSDETEKSTFGRIMSQLALTTLWIKPPYIVLGYSLMIAKRQAPEVLVNFVIALILLSVLTVQFGNSWPLEYLQSLTVYSKEELPAAYVNSLVSQTMVIFSSAIATVIGRGASLSISSFIYLLGSISVLLTLMAKYRSNISKEHLLTLAVGIYLLFAPYAGAYEDCLLLLPLLLLFDFNVCGRLVSVLVLVCLAISLNHGYVPVSSKPVGLFFANKVLLIAVLFYFISQKSTRSVKS